MRKAALVLAAGLALAGCDWLDDPGPDIARVLISGESGTPVELIVSTKFIAALNEVGMTRVVIIEADTIATTLPFDRSFSIRGDQRFFAQLSRLERDVARVHMRVLLDDEAEFDEEGPLLEAAPYRFVYAFNHRMTQQIEIIF